MAQLIHPCPVVDARTLNGQSLAYQLVEKGVHVLAIGGPYKLRILAWDADAAIQHYGYQKSSLALGEPEV